MFCLNSIENLINWRINPSFSETIGCPVYVTFVPCRTPTFTKWRVAGGVFILSYIFETIEISNETYRLELQRIDLSIRSSSVFLNNRTGLKVIGPTDKLELNFCGFWKVFYLWNKSYQSRQRIFVAKILSYFSALYVPLEFVLENEIFSKNRSSIFQPVSKMYTLMTTESYYSLIK